MLYLQTDGILPFLFLQTLADLYPVGSQLRCKHTDLHIGMTSEIVGSLETLVMRVLHSLMEDTVI